MPDPIPPRGSSGAGRPGSARVCGPRAPSPRPPRPALMVDLHHHRPCGPRSVHRARQAHISSRSRCTVRRSDPVRVTQHRGHGRVHMGPHGSGNDGGGPTLASEGVDSGSRPSAGQTRAWAGRNQAKAYLIDVVVETGSLGATEWCKLPLPGKQISYDGHHLQHKQHRRVSGGCGCVGHGWTHRVGGCMIVGRCPGTVLTRGTLRAAQTSPNARGRQTTSDADMIVQISIQKHPWFIPPWCPESVTT